ncbi:hypothetical protein D3C75_862300 [compost metagenome]
MQQDRGHQHHHRHARHALEQPQHGPAYVVTVVDVGKGQAELVGNHALLLIGHQAQGFVERMPGLEGAHHGIQCIRQLLLELGEAFAAVAGDLQDRHPEQHCPGRQCRPPQGKQQPHQHGAACGQRQA